GPQGRPVMKNRERGNPHADSGRGAGTPTPAPRARGGAGEPRRAPVLSVVVPTYNERDSLPQLVSGLAEASQALALELIIVDDASPDGTGTLAEEMAKSAPLRMMVIHRPGKAGSASGCGSGIRCQDFLPSGGRYSPNAAIAGWDTSCWWKFWPGIRRRGSRRSHTGS